MRYTIKGKPLPIFPDTHIVFRLGNFILEKPFYFKSLSKILDRIKKEDQITLLDSIIKETTERETITYPQLVTDVTNNEFRTLIYEMLQVDFNYSGNTRGDLFEYIVSYIGPIKQFENNNLNTKIGCYIVDENDIRIGGNKEFDVVFYCDFNCNEELEAEFIECKTNLNNFLLKHPYNPSNLLINHRAKEKLDYMHEVFIKMQHSRQFTVALATIKSDINLSQKLITASDYRNTIEIYNFNTLQTALNRIAI